MFVPRLQSRPPSLSFSPILLTFSCKVASPSSLRTNRIAVKKNFVVIVGIDSKSTKLHHALFVRPRNKWQSSILYESDEFNSQQYFHFLLKKTLENSLAKIKKSREDEEEEEVSLPFPVRARLCSVLEQSAVKLNGLITHYPLNLALFVMAGRRST